MFKVRNPRTNEEWIAPTVPVAQAMLKAKEIESEGTIEKIPDQELILDAIIFLHKFRYDLKSAGDKFLLYAGRLNVRVFLPDKGLMLEVQLHENPSDYQVKGHISRDYQISHGVVSVSFIKKDNWKSVLKKIFSVLIADYYNYSLGRLIYQNNFRFRYTDSQIKSMAEYVNNSITRRRGVSLHEE